VGSGGTGVEVPSPTAGHRGGGAGRPFWTWSIIHPPVFIRSALSSCLAWCRSSITRRRFGWRLSRAVCGFFHTEYSGVRSRVLRGPSSSTKSLCPGHRGPTFCSWADRVGCVRHSGIPNTLESVFWFLPPEAVFPMPPVFVRPLVWIRATVPRFALYQLMDLGLEGDDPGLSFRMVGCLLITLRGSELEDWRRFGCPPV